MSYSEWPRWCGLNGPVPHVAAPPEYTGVTLQYVEQMRRKVWDEYAYNKRTGASDWDPMTKSYPADPTGVCRHKVRWLQEKLGGVPLYGRLTNRPDPGMHCVLWLRIGDHGFIVDETGVWPEGSAPFVCDATHKAYLR